MTIKAAKSKSNVLFPITLKILFFQVLSPATFWVVTEAEKHLCTKEWAQFVLNFISWKQNVFDLLV